VTSVRGARIGADGQCPNPVLDSENGILVAMPVSEKKLIGRIRRQAGGGRAGGRSAAGRFVAEGIGDDCAVLRIPRGHEMLVTTDFSIEGVHFRRDWHGPEVVGRRCLTRGLSDIAAMGGEPRAVFLSLAVPGDLAQGWVDRFLKGLLALAAEFKVVLAGGDTAQSPSGIVADIIVVGSVPRGKAVLRSGARAGEFIHVTGELGGAAAETAVLSSQFSVLSQGTKGKVAVPRIAVGQWLRRRGLASAMIDLSDGLSTDLEHVCEESGVGAEIRAEAIPRARVGEGGKLVELDFALHGGDDYELLFTSAKRVPARVAGVRVTRIGRVTESTAMKMIGLDGKVRRLRAEGWEHFAKKR
jgi:thiamine-monophosphate kinase